MVDELRMPALTLVACLSLMLTGISRTKVEMMTQRVTPVMVGEMAPDFTLEDQIRRKITLSESRGKSPLALIFYRGYW